MWFKHVRTVKGPDVTLIIQSADAHSARASEYRLNQTTTGLAKASTIKAKETALKKQHNADMVNLEVQLYLYSPNNTVRKRSIL